MHQKPRLFILLKSIFYSHRSDGPCKAHSGRDRKSKKGTAQKENATKAVAFWHSLKMREVLPFSLEFQTEGTKHEQADNKNRPEKDKLGKEEIIILPFSKVLFTLNPLSVEIILPLETTK